MSRTIAAIGTAAMLIATGAALSQTPPGTLQPGTYNAPAGAGAYVPANPEILGATGLRPPFGSPGMPSYLSPGQPLGLPATSRDLLNRDVLNTRQWSWLQFQLQGKAAPAKTSLAKESRTTIKVKLPAGTAQLWVNGQPTRQHGRQRVFVTPFLEPGSYRYHFRVSWGAQQQRSKSVTFQPGEDLSIDFTQ